MPRAALAPSDVGTEMESARQPLWIIGEARGPRGHSTDLLVQQFLHRLDVVGLEVSQVLAGVEFTLELVQDLSQYSFQAIVAPLAG